MVALVAKIVIAVLAERQRQARIGGEGEACLVAPQAFADVGLDQALVAAMA